MAALILAMVLALTAPANDDKAERGDTPMAADANKSDAPSGNSPDSAGKLPKDAVPFGPDTYLIPAGRDSTGCPQFTMYSPTRAVLTVIYYRDAKGGFTTDRAKAVCN